MKIDVRLSPGFMIIGQRGLPHPVHGAFQLRPFFRILTRRRPPGYQTFQCFLDIEDFMDVL
jgi:hypothetical protein